MGMMGSGSGDIPGPILQQSWRLVSVPYEGCQAADETSACISAGKTIFGLGYGHLPFQISLVVHEAINIMHQNMALWTRYSSNLGVRQIPMGSRRIVMKTLPDRHSIAVGMAAGCIPVVGYNVGADETTDQALFTRR
jgi:hypothetical protein